MKPVLTFDRAKWARSIAAVKGATKRGRGDIVNRALKNVAFRAAQFTEKLTPDEIEEILLKDRLLLKITMKTLQREGESLPTKRKGKLKGVKRRRKTGKITRAMISREARKIKARRRQGSGVTRAGWIPAVQKMGGSYRGAKLRAGGIASKGQGRRATDAVPVGSIENAVTRNFTGKGGSKGRWKAEKALGRGINHVADENIRYAKKKIRETLRRVSDK